MAAGPLVLRIACNGLNAALYYEQNGKNACVAKEIDLSFLSTEITGGFTGCTVGSMPPPTAPPAPTMPLSTGSLTSRCETSCAKMRRSKAAPAAAGLLLVYKAAFYREIETFHRNGYYFLVIFDKENGCDSCKATILHSKSKKRLIFAKYRCNIKPQQGWKRYQPVNHTGPQRCNWFHLKRRTIP